MIDDEPDLFRQAGVVELDSHIPASVETDRITNHWFELTEAMESYIVKDGDVLGLSKIAKRFLPKEREIIWFTDDYDLYGCYRDDIDFFVEKVEKIFELGASCIYFMSPDLGAGFSVESYIQNDEFYVKISGYGDPYSGIPNRIQQAAP